MAIGYVSGTTGSSTAASATYVLTYSSTVGSLLVLVPNTNGSVTSVVDSNSVTWSTVATGNKFYYLLNSAAISSVTVNVTSGSGIAMALSEYSLVKNTAPTTFHSTGTNTQSITAHDWLITGFWTAGSTNSAFAAGTGNFRGHIGPINFNSFHYDAAIVDNTSASTGNVTCSVTGGSSATISYAAGDFTPAPASNVWTIPPFFFGKSH